jgi:hypothetical protein
VRRVAGQGLLDDDQLQVRVFLANLFQEPLGGGS